MQFIDYITLFYNTTIRLCSCNLPAAALQTQLKLFTSTWEKYWSSLDEMKPKYAARWSNILYPHSTRQTVYNMEQSIKCEHVPSHLSVQNSGQRKINTNTGDKLESSRFSHSYFLVNMCNWSKNTFDKLGSVLKLKQNYLSEWKIN